MDTSILLGIIGIYISLFVGIIGIIVGGIITYQVSKNYYENSANDLKKESNELKEESKRLRHKTDLILKGLEEAKIIKVSRDSTGDIIGIVYKRTFMGGITPTGEHTKEVDSADNSK